MSTRHIVVRVVTTPAYAGEFPDFCSRQAESQKRERTILWWKRKELKGLYSFTLGIQPELIDQRIRPLFGHLCRLLAFSDNAPENLKS